MKSLEELAKAIVDIPWVKNTSGAIFIGLLFVICILVFTRAKNGAEISIFKFIVVKPDKYLQQLKDSLRDMNEDSKQKTQVIKILNQVSVEVSKAFATKSMNEFVEIKEEIYTYLLYSIGTVLTKQKSNTHRVAIFVDDQNGYLRIHKGIGYSSDGKKKLRLSINKSAAGEVFRTGEHYLCGDVMSSGNLFAPNPKATKSINSLMCIPIKCDKITLGVLSIDGQEKDSFTKDDKDYLDYFANALSSLMFIEYINEHREVGDGNEQVYLQEDLA
ncbi:MAG: GAF domain-containing protein [Gorillibacterium sp.]|nr:GAF domain-containing protein [Gorillibacterium sp.]